MAFEKGHKKYGGRRLGGANKRTLTFMSVLEQNNFCPAHALIQCYQNARSRYEKLVQKDPSLLGQPESYENDACKYLKIASDNAKELASYAYPKLKSVEQQRTSPLDGMTPQQKLEAMKNAVALLEMEIQKNGS